MKVLFDQSTPVPLRNYLDDHEVTTLREKGWSEKSNGELLDLAELEGYEVLVTTDQNLRYQQNMSKRKIALIVLLGTKWMEILPHASKVRAAIDNARRGDVVEIPVRSS